MCEKIRFRLRKEQSYGLKNTREFIRQVAWPYNVRTRNVGCDDMFQLLGQSNVDTLNRQNGALLSTAFRQLPN